MRNGSCIIHEMASFLATEPDLKAVWLDASNQRVSFAFQPGTNTDEAKTRLEGIVAKHQPDDVPPCTTEPWKVVCSVCEWGTSQPMPQGVRLITMPGAGVMLERETCVTSSRFWKWHQIPWVKLTTRRVPTTESLEAQDDDEWKPALLAAILCGLFGLAGWGIEHWGQSLPHWLPTTLYLLSYLAGAWFPAQDVWSLLRQRTLDVHFLMLCVALGAAVIGHWWEGATLLFLFSLSGALEDFAMARTRREVRSLFKHAPKEASLVNAQGNEERVPVETLAPGMTVRLRPGDLVPVDAEVVSGKSAADESSLTGESVPVDKNKGDMLFGGTLNLWGSMDAKVLKPASESSLAKIIRLIHEAQDSKAPAQRFTDKFGTTYTYAILGLSLAMFLVWWLGQGLPAFVAPVGQPSAFYRAMTLLVVASPCALVLSIPSAILAGIAAGARRGVLFRGGAAVEKLAEITKVAMDKTGTLTTGEPAVIAIEALAAGQENELLRAAASLAHHSTHPLSRALSQHATRLGLHLETIPHVISDPGQGLRAQWTTPDGSTTEARLGRREFFGEAAWVHNLSLPPTGVTEVIVQAGPLKGRALLRDELRAGSRPLIATLHKMGLKLAMLTGDRAEAANTIGQSLGLDEICSELKPEGKVAAIQRWTKAGERVAMIGDGVNDAPCLAAAHVSVGMGVRGSDAVLEQSDVVLMKDRLENFLAAVRLSRSARSIIRQNLALSLGTIVVLVCSALGGWIPLTLGVVGHEGSTVIVVLNSLRLLFLRTTEETTAETVDSPRHR
jgi:Cd2+/Zn2+-exporting ATPase